MIRCNTLCWKPIHCGSEYHQAGTSSIGPCFPLYPVEFSSPVLRSTSYSRYFLLCGRVGKISVPVIAYAFSIFVLNFFQTCKGCICFLHEGMVCLIFDDFVLNCIVYFDVFEFQYVFTEGGCGKFIGEATTRAVQVVSDFELVLFHPLYLCLCLDD